MTYYTAAELRQRAGGVTASAAQAKLSHSSKAAPGVFDVFLSHSFRDAVVILGLKSVLEADGLSVYVDWIEDAQRDRSQVNAATASLLRQRMRRCSSLVYATSRSASTSRWMPWELGFFDGAHGSERVAICPIDAGTGNYVGQEYLGLYKTLEKLSQSGFDHPFAVPPSRRQAERVISFASGRGAFVKMS